METIHSGMTWKQVEDALLPPAVCPGSGTVATDLQGMKSCSSMPTEGNCGICGQRVGVDGYQRCLVHPYKVPEARKDSKERSG